jgi:hypothetical protein
MAEVIRNCGDRHRADYHVRYGIRTYRNAGQRGTHPGPKKDFEKKRGAVVEF